MDIASFVGRSLEQNLENSLWNVMVMVNSDLILEQI